MTTKKLAAGVLAAAAVALAAPATANATIVDKWVICNGTNCDSSAQGDITWHNRTADVSGIIWDQGFGSTTIKFRAYANGRQIGPEVARTANDETSDPNVKSPRKIGFPMGDTNLPGGIDEIRIWICFTTCVDSTTEYRDH